MSSSSHDRRSRAARGLARIASAGAMIAAAPATAQPVPRLEVDARALASGNPLLIDGVDREAGLLEVSVRPGVSLTTATGSTFDLSAVVTDRAYTRRYGNFVLGRAQASAEYRDSERLSVGGLVRFSRDLAVDLLTGSVEAGVDPTSIRTGYLVRGSATWRPDEYSWIVPEIGAEKYDFTRTALLGDTRALFASLGYRRRTGPRTRLGVRTGAIFNRMTRLSDSSTAFLYGTGDYRLNDRWRVTGELGVERNDARLEEVLGVRVRQGARALLSGRAELCREVPGPAVCVSAALNSEVSGLGGLQRRAVANASYSQAIDARSTLTVEGGYQRTVMQGDAFPEFDAIRLAGTVQRRIARALSLGGTAQYLRRRLPAGNRIGAAFAGLRLTYTPELR